ncbi:hypothetical protein GALMADRAFT_213016 [Galerina marginata CBS 339.88]|uniref:Uncharacterized protein n=1 Tax=Galerina marginata (strain CBS 339.88) TaxID=685588 RepID=A0A067T229_GALM3|nr:hypothetical protein GALMADRAFT_213016 [Galerina marginata CBS 339.88]
MSVIHPIRYKFLTLTWPQTIGKSEFSHRGPKNLTFRSNPNLDNSFSPPLASEMPSHPKAAIIEREIIFVPGGDVQPGTVVEVTINPQTIVTIFGVTSFSSVKAITTKWKQKVLAELIDDVQGPQDTVFFDGAPLESFVRTDDSNEKTVNWGPFDKQMTVVVTFYQPDPSKDDFRRPDDEGAWKFTSNDLQTDIHVDDGGDSAPDVQNTTFNVTRMTCVSSIHTCHEQRELTPFWSSLF